MINKVSYVMNVSNWNNLRNLLQRYLSERCILTALAIH